MTEPQNSSVKALELPNPNVKAPDPQKL